MLLVPRDLFVPRDRHREAFRDNKVVMRLPDGSTLTLPPPSFVVNALEHLDVGPGKSFLDVGCGTGYVAALAACLLGGSAAGCIHGVECVGSRLEQARSNIKALKDRLAMVSGGGAASSSNFSMLPACPSPSALALAGTALGDPLKALSCVDLKLGNVSLCRANALDQLFTQCYCPCH
jgi:SAM-dependent methyltransferase